jgi:Skp family chaperone for outer membrane proteins
MKLRMVLACGLLLPGAAWGADGEDNSGPKVGVVKVAQVFEGYQMTRDLENRFDGRRRAIGDEAENRRKAMDNQRAALEAFDPASRDYAERREGLRRAAFEYKVWLEMEEQRLKEEHMAWLRMIYEDVCGAVAKAAQARGIDLVLTCDELSQDIPDSVALRQEILLKKVLYFSGRIDLTESVLRRLNEGYEEKGGAASLRQPPATGVSGSTPEPLP